MPEHGCSRRAGTIQERPEAPHLPLRNGQVRVGSGAGFTKIRGDAGARDLHVARRSIDGSISAQRMTLMT